MTSAQIGQSGPHRWAAKHRRTLRILGVLLFVLATANSVWTATGDTGLRVSTVTLPLGIAIQAILWGWLLPSEHDRARQVLVEEQAETPRSG